jgi:hypothetical protein
MSELLSPPLEHCFKEGGVSLIEQLEISDGMSSRHRHVGETLDAAVVGLKCSRNRGLQLERTAEQAR